MLLSTPISFLSGYLRRERGASCSPSCILFLDELPIVSGSTASSQSYEIVPTLPPIYLICPYLPLFGSEISEVAVVKLSTILFVPPIFKRTRNERLAVSHRSVCWRERESPASAGGNIRASGSEVRGYVPARLERKYTIALPSQVESIYLE